MTIVQAMTTHLETVRANAESTIVTESASVTKCAPSIDHTYIAP